MESTVYFFCPTARETPRNDEKSQVGAESAIDPREIAVPSGDIFVGLFRVTMGSSRENKKNNGFAQGFEKAKSGTRPELRYRILTPIGSGATATVYRARDTDQNRDVALKILNLDVGSEWDALAGLVHPSIVTVFERGRIPDPKDKKVLRPFIAMELLPGTSLKTEIPHVRSWTESVQIIRQCSLAIAYLHEQGKCHLDLKPSNVHISRLVSNQLSGVKVLDFGLSEALSGDGIVAGGGTYAYMSPEQISDGKVNEASDVFSLGVLSYELLTRKHPFALNLATASKEELRIRISHSTPAYIGDLDPKVPETIAWAIHRTLAKEPGQRPSAADLVRYLDSMEPFVRERAGIVDRLAPTEALLRTDIEKASKELETFERQGWAFPEIVSLRHKISAIRADLEVQRRVTDAKSYVQRPSNMPGSVLTYNLGQATESLKSAQMIPSRRFDIRVLFAEAKIEWERRVDGQARSEYDSAQKSADHGEMRRAEWFLGRLNNLELASPALLSNYTAHAEGLTSRIANFYSEELAILSEPQRIAGFENEAGIPHFTKAVEARTLQIEAKRQELILRKTLELLGTADPEKQKALNSELERLRASHTSDAVQVVAAVTQRRREIIDDLRRDLEDRERADDLPGALQAAESLLKIVPDKQLENKQAELRIRFNRELDEDWVQKASSTLDALSTIGDYRSAAELLDEAQLRSPRETRFLERQVLVDDRLSKSVARDGFIDQSLEDLRQCSIDDAIQHLSSAHELDPDSHVLAVALAALISEKDRQQSLVGDQKASLNDQRRVAALLSQCGEDTLLRHALHQVKGLPPELVTVATSETTRGPQLQELSESVDPTTVHDRPSLGSMRGTISRRLRGIGALFGWGKTLFLGRPTSWLLPVLGVVAIALLGVTVYEIIKRLPGSGGKPKEVVVIRSHLTFEVTPATASILIDGNALTGSSIDLLPGKHPIRISAPGYEPKIDENFEVDAHPKPYRFQLTPLPLALSFENTAENTTVLLDGGEFSDGAKVPADEKQHRLTARFPQHGELEINFTSRAASIPELGALPPDRGLPVVVVSSFKDRAVVYANRKGFPVALNGEQKGEATASGLELNGIPTQNGAVVSIGANKTQRSFQLDASDPPLLRIFVIGSGSFGSILVLSNEDDSKITINGQLVTRTIKNGQMPLPGVRPGDYSISVTKEGFCVSPESSSVTVKDGEQVKAKFELQPYPPIRIEGRPLGTKLLIDNREVLGDLATGLPLGIHSVKATNNAYNDFLTNVQTSCGSSPVLKLADMHLKEVVPPKQTVFRIPFTVEPDNALVTLLHSDKIPVIVTSPLSLEPGSYTLRATRDGYEPLERPLIVKAGGTSPDIKLVLNPMPLKNIEHHNNWIPELVPDRGQWKKATDISFYGDDLASGVYTFKVKKHRFLSRFGSWLVGYPGRKDYYEFKVEGNEFQWRKNSGKWAKVQFVVPEKTDEIFVRLTIQSGTVSTELGGTASSISSVGAPVSVTGGKFGIKDATIAEFIH